MATEDRQGQPKDGMASDGEKEDKWITHYSSSHQILLVGEGDFSFSLSLANAFGCASHICATSLDSYDALIKKYNKAKSNLENLQKLGASLLHQVDATKMEHHPDLANRKFDRIIFNFPHAGFYGREDNAHLIEMHRSLVQDFFRNARGMLGANGEIHINHKNNAPFCHWSLEELASGNSLVLVELVNFNKEDYPGYQNKRGHGSKCDEPFPLGASSTFKFRFCDRGKVYKATRSQGTQQFRNIPMQLRPSCSDFNNYPQRNLYMNQSPVPHTDTGLPCFIINRNQNYGVLDANLNGMGDAYQRYHNYDVAYSVPGGIRLDLDVTGEMRHGVERQMVEVPRTLNGDLYYWRELHRIRALAYCQGCEQNASTNTHKWQHR